ncbi:MAG: helix-turn-helix domain-containing protein [Candidatus Woesebacteria bacterium]|nr:MAG: helix-turn-helix domain-containing protein [Candidatus Woesebacteria bacterium]
MNTIGQIIKNARVVKEYSLSRLEEITKIKKGFISSIEEENWEELPPFPTVLGFVKSIAGALEVDERTAVATLKRDYPPKKLRINPKPDVSRKFVWSPKLTFIIGVGLVFTVIFGYLAFQYTRFISPPALSVDSPVEDQIVSGNNVLVFGNTDVDVKITVNNQPVLVDNDGKFSVSMEVVPDTKEIVIQAVSRSGKMNEVRRKILVTSN